MFVNNFEDLTKDNLLSFTDIQDTLNVTKKRNKNKKVKKTHSMLKQKQDRDLSTSSSESTDSSTSSVSSEGEDFNVNSNRKKHRSKKCKSDLHAKAINEKITSNEWYAHTALDQEIGGNSKGNLL